MDKVKQVDNINEAIDGLDRIMELYLFTDYELDILKMAKDCMFLCDYLFDNVKEKKSGKVR